jgi:hypothetical protein
MGRATFIRAPVVRVERAVLRFPNPARHVVPIALSTRQRRQDNLQAEAQKLLRVMRDLPPREPGDKLRARDELKILQLHGQRVSQTDIARPLAAIRAP